MQLFDSWAGILGPDQYEEFSLKYISQICDAITEVPVGIKLINGDVALPGSPQTVDTPTSFLAISELLARLMAHDPYAPGAQSLAELAQGLPQTAAVSENEGTLFLSQGSRTMMRTADGAWSPYAAR